MKGKVCGDFCEFTLDKGHFITGDREGDTDPDTCTGGHTIKGYW